MSKENFDFIKVMSNATFDMIFLSMLLDALSEKELYPVLAICEPIFKKEKVIIMTEKFKIDLYTKEEMIENEMDIEGYKQRLNNYLRTVKMK